jgi:fluoroquinolone transport system permease protein
MQMTQLVRNLGRNDVKIIGRDSFLITMFIYMMGMAVVMRFGLPWLNTYLAEDNTLPNEPMAMTFADVYPMIVAFIAIFLGAVMVGMIFGFVLLDEKDDNTIKAILVTPVPLNQYVSYRVGVPAIIAFFCIIAEVLLINQALVPLWQLLLIAAGASLTAPITALFFATFAENKVQGFAMTKFAGMAGMVIMLGWFVAEPLQWLFGLFPPFWISKAYWLALEGNNFWWMALLVGIVLQAGLIVWLVQRFNTAAYK